MLQNHLNGEHLMTYKILAVALGLSIASLAPAANAQATTGNIIGEAKAGDTIYVTNSSTGWKREMKITKDGKYQVRNLSAGTYHVIPMHADGSFEPSLQMEVHVGMTSRAMAPPKAEEPKTP